MCLYSGTDNILFFLNVSHALYSVVGHLILSADLSYTRQGRGHGVVVKLCHRCHHIGVVGFICLVPILVSNRKGLLEIRDSRLGAKYPMVCKLHQNLRFGNFKFLFEHVLIDEYCFEIVR